jgi:hypothetical protein
VLNCTSCNAAMEHTPTTTLTHLLMNEIKLLHL